MEKKNKTYPFTKTEFVKRFKKPSILLRLNGFFDGLKQGCNEFMHPMVDEYNRYPICYIWGNVPNGNLYSMDDICIIYNEKEQMYYLCIETAFLIGNQLGWAEYLKMLLVQFTEFMEINGYDTDAEKELFMDNPKIELKSQTIEGLYTEFRLFVNAFCSTYGAELPEFENGEDDENGDLEFI